MRKKREVSGEEVMDLLDKVSNRPDEIFEDTEITPSRVQAIYAQTKFGKKSVLEISEYYNLPRKLVYDIKHGKAFRELTREMDDM